MTRSLDEWEKVCFGSQPSGLDKLSIYSVNIQNPLKLTWNWKCRSETGVGKLDSGFHEGWSSRIV